jgi:hypothetical protein
MIKISVLNAIVIFMLSGVSLAEELVVVATIVHSQPSEYSNGQDTDCEDSNECLVMAWWREYKAIDVAVISGDFKGNEIFFLMKSHTNWAQEGNPLKAVLRLNESDLVHPKYEVSDWGILEGMVCFESPLPENETYTSGESDDINYCYKTENLISE